MDARILCSGHGLQAARYALQYTVKQQTTLTNVAVVNMALKKRVDRETTLTQTEYARDVARLLSLTYANSGAMEVGGPLATVIILDGEAVTFSCDFERLILVKALNILNNFPAEATVVRHDNQLNTETSILKYIQRPTCLEGFSWYNYCCWCHKNGRSGVSIRDCIFTSTDIAQLRAHLRLCGITYADYPRVPEIVGPRLPDATRLGDEDDVDQTELYYRMATLLYKLFRCVKSILGDSTSAKQVFTRWNPDDDSETARALEHHQQYYTCLRMAEIYRARQKTEGDDNSDDGDMSADDDILAFDASRTAPRSRVEYTLIPAEFYDADPELDIGDDRLHPQEDAAPALHHLLLHSIVTSTLPDDKSKELTVCATAITRANVMNFIHQDRTLAEQATAEAGERHEGSTSVVVQAFERAIQDRHYDSASSAVTQISAHASIAEVSPVPFI